MPATTSTMAVSSDADGGQLSFELLLGGGAPMRVAQQFARDLERLGIKVDVRQVDDSQYQERMIEYDFDMAVYFWGQSLSPGNEQAFYWHSRSADQPGTRNYMGVKDPLVDRLVERIPAARSREELVAATRLLDRVLRAGHYVIPLYHLDVDRIAHWDRIEGPAHAPVMGFSLDTWWATQTP